MAVALETKVLDKFVVVFDRNAMCAPERCRSFDVKYVFLER